MLGSVQDVDLKLLRIFETIVECGSFTLAQTKLNLSQSAISTSMSQLETRLGARLCERGHGIFRLTDEGISVLSSSRKLFVALEDFRAEVAESQKKLVGELNIGLLDNFVTHSNTLITDALKHFSDNAPNVRIKIHVLTPLELEAKVLDGHIQIAIGLFHRRINGINYKKILTEEHLLYCGKEHPFFNDSDKNISPEKFSNTNYVSWDYIESSSEMKLPYSFNTVASSSSVDGVAYFVLSGRYLAYLPVHYASNWVNKGLMRALLPESICRTSDIYVITSASRSPNLLTREFYSAIGIKI